MKKIFLIVSIIFATMFADAATYSKTQTETLTVYTSTNASINDATGGATIHTISSTANKITYLSGQFASACGTTNCAELCIGPTSGNSPATNGTLCFGPLGAATYGRYAINGSAITLTTGSGPNYSVSIDGTTATHVTLKDYIVYPGYFIYLRNDSGAARNTNYRLEVVERLQL